VVRLVVLASIVASCTQAQSTASAPQTSAPQPSAWTDRTSTRVELGAQGQLMLLVDTPGGVVALGGYRLVPWALLAADGVSWQPVDAPPELEAMTEVGSATFRGAAYVLLYGTRAGIDRLELLISTDGFTWRDAAPALMAKVGMWGVGIVATGERLVVVGATAKGGVSRAEVFVSSDGTNWEGVESPDLTRTDGAPVGVASAGGSLALLFSGRAGGGAPHVLISGSDLRSWSAVDLTADSPSVTVIAPFLGGLAVEGCTGDGSRVTLVWVSSSPGGRFGRLDNLAADLCVDAGASSGGQLALATKAGAWFVDSSLSSSGGALPTATPGALTIVRTVIHRGDAWLFGGQEYPGGNPLGTSQAVVWTIRH